MTRPVFLVYDSRSGSTFLSSRMDGYDDIGVTLESRFMYAILSRRGDFEAADSCEQVLDILFSGERFETLELRREDLRPRLPQKGPYSIDMVTAAVLSAYFERTKPTARVHVVKDGANGLMMNQIAEAMDHALFIHVVRDGRAVFNSKRKTRRPYGRGEHMARDPLTTVRFWKGLVDRVDAFAAAHPEKVLTVRYEKLLADKDGVLAEIRRFLDLPEAPAAREVAYAEKIPEKEAEIHTLVSRDAVLSRVDGWKEELDRDECLVFDAFANDTLRRHGYETLTSGVSDVLRSPRLMLVVGKSWLLRVRDWCRLLLDWRTALVHLKNRALMRKG